jgi:hypothetical protein
MAATPSTPAGHDPQKKAELKEVFRCEVNPCPAFSFCECNTGQPIAASLARYLAADST